MNLKVSIIIPVYNSGKFINRCLDSVINQTYKNLEILVINDGSKDNSDEIIRSYSDDRIKYIIQENKGLSGARNTGIDNATGDYIMFLDSDDSIDLDSIDLLVERIKRDKLDISIAMLRYLKDDNEYNINRSLNPNIVDDGIEAINKMLKATDIRFHAVAKLIKRELFEGLYFPEGRLYEDTGFMYKVIFRAERVGYINRKIYNYYYNVSSISKSDFNSKKFDLMHFTNDIKEFLLSKNAYDRCKKNYINFKTDAYLSLYRDIKKSNQEHINKYVRELNTISNIDYKILVNTGVQSKNKLKFMLKKFIF